MARRLMVILKKSTQTKSKLVMVRQKRLSSYPTSFVSYQVVVRGPAELITAKLKGKAWQRKITTTFWASKGCFDAEIKRAYRKLAAKYHPMSIMNQGRTKSLKTLMKLRTLSDAQKRSQYDQFVPLAPRALTTRLGQGFGCARFGGARVW